MSYDVLADHAPRVRGDDGTPRARVLDQKHKVVLVVGVFGGADRQGGAGNRRDVDNFTDQCGSRDRAIERFLVTLVAEPTVTEVAPLGSRPSS